MQKRLQTIYTFYKQYPLLNLSAKLNLKDIKGKSIYEGANFIGPSSRIMDISCTQLDRVDMLIITDSYSSRENQQVIYTTI